MQWILSKSECMKLQLLVFFSLFLFFGCTGNKFLDKNMDTFVPDRLLAGNSSSVVLGSSQLENVSEDHFSLRYYGFEQMGGVDLVKLESYSNNGSKEFQAVLYENETISLPYCDHGMKLTVDKIITCDNSLCQRGVKIIVSTSSLPSARELLENSTLEVSCSSLQVLNKTNNTITLPEEASLVYVGQKIFVKDGDLLRDSSCPSSVNYDNIRVLPYNFMGKPEFADFGLKRYLFRPNTLVCNGSDIYFLKEDQYSKQCNTWLGKRNPESTGCRNMLQMFDDFGDLLSEN